MSPHPKDFPPQLLQLIAERHNICSSLHLPLQSGSDEVRYLLKKWMRSLLRFLIYAIHTVHPSVTCLQVLKRMRRGYGDAFVPLWTTLMLTLTLMMLVLMVLVLALMVLNSGTVATPSCR